MSWSIDALGQPGQVEVSLGGDFFGLRQNSSRLMGSSVRYYSFGTPTTFF